MPSAPAFFVPNASPEQADSVYAGFARMCGVPVPPIGERVYSITYRHNGEVWTATVGETLKGTKYSSRKVKGKVVERTEALSDPARVLAIFPGSPFMVATDFRLVPSVMSRWENPFLAGAPDAVVLFES